MYFVTNSPDYTLLMSGGDKQVRAEDGVSMQEERLLNYIISGLPQSAAARSAGYNFKDMKQGAKAILRRPPVKARLLTLRQEAARRAKVTQDDIIEGFKEAITDAKLTSDPTAQIAGWREIAKLLGFYAPEVKKLELSTVEMRARKELSELPEEKLIEMAGNEGVIEGEFNVLDD